MGQRTMPLWRALMDGGYAYGRAQAESLVLAGSVFVNGQQAAYAGERVKPDARIAVKGSERKYVGKGGLKLEGALRHFQIDVTGRIALDAGASTGGFTDCLPLWPSRNIANKAEKEAAP